MSDLVIVNKEDMVAIADGFRSSRGLTTELSVGQMAVLAAENIGGGGGDVVSDGSPFVIENEIRNVNAYTYAEDKGAVYQYYRLHMTEFYRGTNKVQFANIGEFALYDNDGNNIARDSGVTYSANSTFSNNPLTLAFDGDSMTHWDSDWSGAPSEENWLQVKLARPAMIKSFGIAPHGERVANPDHPQTFKLLASNDGNSWKEIASYSNLSDGWTGGVERIFDIV